MAGNWISGHLDGYVVYVMALIFALEFTCVGFQKGYHGGYTGTAYLFDSCFGFCIALRLHNILNLDSMSVMRDIHLDVSLQCVSS